MWSVFRRVSDPPQKRQRVSGVKAEESSDDDLPLSATKGEGSDDSDVPMASQERGNGVKKEEEEEEDSDEPLGTQQRDDDEDDDEAEGAMPPATVAR